MTTPSGEIVQAPAAATPSDPKQSLGAQLQDNGGAVPYPEQSRISSSVILFVAAGLALLCVVEAVADRPFHVRSYFEAKIAPAIHH